MDSRLTQYCMAAVVLFAVLMIEPVARGQTHEFALIGVDGNDTQDVANEGQPVVSEAVRRPILGRGLPFGSSKTAISAKALAEFDEAIHCWISCRIPRPSWSVGMRST